ncbi:MAG: HAD family hydrolase [Chloroflexi bacterium]|nr:HAD family hydrolase [Chloroflexota bacterium]
MSTASFAIPLNKPAAFANVVITRCPPSRDLYVACLSVQCYHIAGMIKAVFFDMYGTLARFYPPKEELQATACGDFDIQVAQEGIKQGYAVADAYMAQENARLPVRIRSSQAREAFFAEYERLVLQGAGVVVSPEKAKEIWHRLRQLPYDLALYDDVLPALNMLKGLGLTLGMISNTDETGKQLAERLGLAGHLDFAVTSGEVGAEKPHSPIFLAALERAGVEPGEALHVGDQISSDVEGARAVGINAALMDRDGVQRDIQECPRVERLMDVVKLIPGYL